MSERITITRGLSELKLLDKKITDGINRFGAVDLFQKRNPERAILSMKDKSKFEAEAKADMASILDMIARRSAIKSGINSSNAKNIIDLGGITMTVAMAIDAKETMIYKKLFLDKIKRDFIEVNKKIQTNKTELENRVDTLVRQSLGTDKKVDKDLYKQVADPIYEANDLIIIDPVNVQGVIKKIEEELDAFLLNIDFLLSESNAQNYITI